MAENEKTSLSFGEFDEQHNLRPENCDFDGVVERAMSRRRFLGGTLVMSTAAFVMGTTALTPSPARGANRFGFEQIAANTLDTITVPDGYSWHLVVK